MNKSAIKNFAMWAREKLIADIIYKAGLYGVTENGAPDPLPASTADLKLFDIGTSQPAKVSGEAIGQRQKLIAAIRLKRGDFKTAFHQVMEEVAYTWFNRLIALRFMEVNDYLPSRVRVLSSENPNKAEPDFVTTPFETDLEFTDDQRREVLRMKEENRLNDLFRMLFIMQCNKLHEILPRLFEPTDDYTELLLNISFTDKDGVVWRLTHDIPEQDFNVGQDGQIEIIGWLYQHYNTELKNQVFANLKKNIKISKEDIPAATQLFTPEWIVRYMVENSLGRIWVEGHPDFDRSGWRYYLEEAEQTPEVQAQLDALRESRKSLRPEEIKCIDPCAGSGHVLDYMFDVLLQIYESQGYNRRDAASLILKNNLYGLDIDERAAQLAYFSVMMKARGVDRKFFTRGVQPHVYDVPETYGELAKPSRKFDMGIQLYNAFRDGKEVGSLLDVGLSESELNQLKLQMDEMEQSGDATDLAAAYVVRPLWEVALMLTQKYTVVATNPPYMASRNMNLYLSKFVKDNYPDSKSDMFAVFIERCHEMLIANGLLGMITMHSWMFLDSFDSLRKRLQKVDLISLVHLGIKAFEEIGNDVVQTVAFILQNCIILNRIASFIRLVDYKDYEQKQIEFFNHDNRYSKNVSKFLMIPGLTYAYWVSDSFVDNFRIGKYIESFGEFTGSQNVTGDNERFLRCFWEVDATKIKRDYWVFYAKGGDYRKYYGNIQMVIDWRLPARRFYETNKTSNLLSEHLWFREGITYSAVTSRGTGFRLLPEGCVFDKGGPSITVTQHLWDIIALLNSKVAEVYFKVFNPSINLQVKDIKSFPLIFPKDESLSDLGKRNTVLAQMDWDMQETSFGFSVSPLIHDKITAIEAAVQYLENSQRCRFEEAQCNEKAINECAIALYHMPETNLDLEPRDIPVRLINRRDTIVNLISYAVGCMFGRYSLDVPGLVFAGGVWDSSKYSVFMPDADNCIPITDEPYFEDDIVGRFVEFIRVVYGDDSLEDNLSFIAKAIGGKDNTSREIIRSYFLNDFFNDHCATYSVTGSGKRPIYWLFDSGKQNGFKALVYMHRWNADTVGNVRVEYLHRIQRVYEKEMERMKSVMESGSAREAAAAAKRLDRLTKQLKETREYDTRIAHAALSRVTIDLDDGVKVNYEKVQQGPDGKSLNLLAKIK